MAAPNTKANATPSAAPQERSIGELLGELAKETTTLVQQEVNLAKAEMSQKVAKVGKDVGAIAVGGAVLYAGLLTLIAGLVLTLAQLRVIDTWASALIIGLIVTIVGAVLVKKGLDDIKNTDPVPRQTIDTLKEDKEWAKDQAR